MLSQEVAGSLLGSFMAVEMKMKWMVQPMAAECAGIQRRAEGNAAAKAMATAKKAKWGEPVRAVKQRAGVRQAPRRWPCQQVARYICRSRKVTRFCQYAFHAAGGAAPHSVCMFSQMPASKSACGEHRSVLKVKSAKNA